jgi:Sporulation protein YtfJ (Spore_YtfJ)
MGGFLCFEEAEEKRMKNSISNSWTLIPVLLLGVAFAVAQSEYEPRQQAPQGQQGGAGVKVNPSAVQQKAQTPPPSTASPASSVGNRVQMTPPSGTVSWAETMDVDGNGKQEQATLAWDAQDKVLLSNSSGTFTCSNGSAGNGELLIAVNGAGNKWNRPVGSGFWLASLDKGQCGAQANTLWGCKFDASGNPTTCGVAQLDQQNEDLIIVTAQRVR